MSNDATHPHKLFVLARLFISHSAQSFMTFLATMQCSTNTTNIMFFFFGISGKLDGFNVESLTGINLILFFKLPITVI